MPAEVATRCSAAITSVRVPYSSVAPQRAGDGRLPLAYPAACRPQAWSAAAALVLLTAILGYCDLALEGIPADSTASEDVAEVRRAAQRAAELTHQLLAFSRRQVLKPRVFSLGTALEQTEKILRRLISENIALELTVCPQQAMVCADPTQVEQVILNLAVNARDAMPRGGRLRLSTGTVTFETPHSTAGRNLPAGSYAMLAVSDTGTGIAPEIRDRLFEPFFTTKPRGQGTGLGLATVYGIMQQSGGGIEVASVPGNGTTFILYFPIAAAEHPAETSAVPLRDTHRRGEGTILLAEDDEAVRAIARETLERAGYRVLAAADGSSALALATAHDGPIDLLLGYLRQQLVSRAFFFKRALQ